MGSGRGRDPDDGDLQDLIDERDWIHRELLGEDEWAEIVEILEQRRRRARERHRAKEGPENEGGV